MGFFTPLAIISKALYRSFVPAQKYELAARLYGHRDSIHSVEASRRADGTIVVASAGEFSFLARFRVVLTEFRQGWHTSLGGTVDG